MRDSAKNAAGRQTSSCPAVDGDRDHETMRNFRPFFLVFAWLSLMGYDGLHVPTLCEHAALCALFTSCFGKWIRNWLWFTPIKESLPVALAAKTQSEAKKEIAQRLFP
jgi:hypothetical protein